MPKVYLTKGMRLRENLVSWIYGQMMVNGMSQQKIASTMGLTQQGFHLKLKRQSVSFDDFCFFLETFQPDLETLLQLVGANWIKGE